MAGNLFRVGACAWLIALFSGAFVAALTFSLSILFSRYVYGIPIGTAQVISVFTLVLYAAFAFGFVPALLGVWVGISVNAWTSVRSVVVSALVSAIVGVVLSLPFVDYQLSNGLVWIAAVAGFTGALAAGFFVRSRLLKELNRRFD